MIPGSLMKEAEAAWTHGEFDLSNDKECFMSGVRWLFTRLCEMSEPSLTSFWSEGVGRYDANEVDEVLAANQAALLKAREMLERVESERDLHIQVATGQAQTISEMQAKCERMEKTLRAYPCDQEFVTTGSLPNGTYIHKADCRKCQTLSGG